MKTNEYEDLKYQLTKLEKLIFTIRDYLYQLIIVLEIRCKNDITYLEIDGKRLLINSDVNLELKDYKTLEDLMSAVRKVKGYSSFIQPLNRRNMEVSKLTNYRFENKWGTSKIELVIKL